MIRFFSKFPKVVCCFSSQQDGNLSFKYSSQNVVSNRKKFLQLNNFDLDNLVCMDQVHGHNVKLVNNENRGAGAVDSNSRINNCDGLVTSSRRLILGVETADCLPVFFFDPVVGVVGAIHAGWRGVVNNIVGNGVDFFQNNFNSAVNNIQVAIGPHIRQCHFEIKEDVLENFASYSEFIEQNNGKYFVSLLGIVKQQLVNGGISEKNIEISDICTYCDSDYFCYRRDGQALQGAMLGLIKLID